MKNKPNDRNVRLPIYDVGVFEPGDFRGEAMCAYRTQGRIAERLEIILPWLFEHINLEQEVPEVYMCAKELSGWLDKVKP